MTAHPLVTLQNVTKSFDHVTVIHDVTVNVYPGQVQVLLGENGAGKSTLIKMVAGVYQPDGGQILVDGTETTLPTTRDAERHGIATIHQELNLVASLSVAENVMLGRTPTRFGMVDRTELRRQARAAMALIGLDVDVDTMVGDLGIAQQQLVEIAKALSIDARVLILDEPTAALTRHETQALFAVMADLRQRGVGMLFISHHLDEIAEVGDTVTVIRDGHFIAEVPASTSEDELVQLMVGRSIDDQFPRRADESPALTEVLAVSHLSSAAGSTTSASPFEPVRSSGSPDSSAPVAPRSSVPSPAPTDTTPAPSPCAAPSFPEVTCRRPFGPGSATSPKTARVRASCSTRRSTTTSGTRRCRPAPASVSPTSPVSGAAPRPSPRRSGSG